MIILRPIALFLRELWRMCTCFGHARRVVKYGGCWFHD